MTFVCATCRENKSLSAFGARPACKLGHLTTCKACYAKRYEGAYVKSRTARLAFRARLTKAGG